MPYIAHLTKQRNSISWFVSYSFTLLLLPRYYTDTLNLGFNELEHTIPTEVGQLKHLCE